MIGIAASVRMQQQTWRMRYCSIPSTSVGLPKSGYRVAVKSLERTRLHVCVCVTVGTVVRTGEAVPAPRVQPEVE